MGNVADIVCAKVAATCHSVPDSGGARLVEGCWVECSKANVMVRSTGKVKFIYDDKVTVNWPAYGTTTHTAQDVEDLGIVRVMADKDGKKFEVGQVVVCPFTVVEETQEDHPEAFVKAVTPDNVTLCLVGHHPGIQDCASHTPTLRQKDIESRNIKVTSGGTLGGHRQRCCATGMGCF